MERTARERVGWELKALEHAVRVRKAASHSARQDTIVTLLIDHSGSMRGGRMLLTAAAVEVALPFLMRLDLKVEVLGFTTRSWKGGWSRRLWRWTGRKPALVGCAISFILYTRAPRADRLSAFLRTCSILICSRRMWTARHSCGPHPDRIAGRSPARSLWRYQMARRWMTRPSFRMTRAFYGIISRTWSQLSSRPERWLNYKLGTKPEVRSLT